LNHKFAVLTAESESRRYVAATRRGRPIRPVLDSMPRRARRRPRSSSWRLSSSRWPHFNSAPQAETGRVVKQSLNAYLTDSSIHQIADVGLIFIHQLHKLPLREAAPVAKV